MFIKNKGAATAFVGLVAMVGVAVTYPYIFRAKNYQYYRPASKSTNESIEDISTDTIAYYTEMLAWFTGILAVVSVAQGYFLYRADKLVQESLTNVQRAFVFIKTFELT